MTTSYDNHQASMVIGCDTIGCKNDDHADGTFKECIAEFKTRGWKTFMVGGEWRNSCAECFQKWKEEQKEIERQAQNESYAGVAAEDDDFPYESEFDSPEPESDPDELPF